MLILLVPGPLSYGVALHLIVLDIPGLSDDRLGILMKESAGGLHG